MFDTRRINMDEKDIQTFDTTFAVESAKKNC